jgi:hypothetical protein
MKSKNKLLQSIYFSFKRNGYGNVFIIFMIFSFIDEIYSINNKYFTLVQYSIAIYGLKGYCFKFYKNYQDERKFKFVLWLLLSIIVMFISFYRIYELLGI